MGDLASYLLVMVEWALKVSYLSTYLLTSPVSPSDGQSAKSVSQSVNQSVLSTIRTLVRQLIFNSCTSKLKVVSERREMVNPPVIIIIYSICSASTTCI